MRLTARRARYLDDNGTLSAAFLPGVLSQSLCSPWTHDFRDCGCFSGLPTIPTLLSRCCRPTRRRTNPGTPPWHGNAASAPLIRRPRRCPQPRTRRTNCATTDQQPLAGAALLVGRREITAPFVQNPVVGVPFASRAELMENLNYAAGVELAVAQEYLAAAYSLKPDNDPSLGASADLRDDVRATRAELLRIAIGEMRHIRAVNDVIRGFSDPGTFEPALRVASQLPHQNPGPFQPVNPRAATRAAIQGLHRDRGAIEGRRRPLQQHPRHHAVSARRCRSPRHR